MMIVPEDSSEICNKLNVSFNEKLTLLLNLSIY